MRVYMCDRCHYYYHVPTDPKKHLTNLSISSNGTWKPADLCAECSKLLDEWYANIPGDANDDPSMIGG